MGLFIAKQEQVKLDIVASYLFALRSWHIDHEFSTAAFETPRIKLMLAAGRSFFPSTKALSLPITKDILTALTMTLPNNINDPNLDAAFKVAWAGFMRLGELIYTSADKNNASFKDLRLTRSDHFLGARSLCYTDIEKKQNRRQSYWSSHRASCYQTFHFLRSTTLLLPANILLIVSVLDFLPLEFPPWGLLE